VFTVAGPAWAFAANMLSFTAVYWALTRLPVRTRTARATHLPLWDGIREGFGVARADPGIRLALATVLAIAVLVAPFVGLVPVFALEVFHRGPETASLFTTAQGAGAIVGAFAMAPLVRRFGLRRIAVWATLALGPCAVAYWLSPSPGAAAVCISMLGAAYLASLTSFNTIGQLRAPREAQARVSSIHSMLLGGGYALGLVALGALADRFGLRLLLASAAVAFAVMVAIGLMLATEGVAALEPNRVASGAFKLEEHPEEALVLAEPGEPDLVTIAPGSREPGASRDAECPPLRAQAPSTRPPG
jgi:predicted MFS family arabinose efflux permease